MVAGSNRGVDRAAAIYSLRKTAKLKPGLRDVLERIAGHPLDRIGEMLPWNWSPAAPAAEAA